MLVASNTCHSKQLQWDINRHTMAIGISGISWSHSSPCSFESQGGESEAYIFCPDNIYRTDFAVFFGLQHCFVSTLLQNFNGKKKLSKSLISMLLSSAVIFSNSVAPQCRWSWFLLPLLQGCIKNKKKKQFEAQQLQAKARKSLASTAQASKVNFNCLPQNA